MSLPPKMAGPPETEVEPAPQGKNSEALSFAEAARKNIAEAALFDEAVRKSIAATAKYTEAAQSVKALELGWLGRLNLSSDFANFIRGAGAAMDPLPQPRSDLFFTSDAHAYLADKLAMHGDTLRALESMGLPSKPKAGAGHGGKKAG